ncbi:hypothetical protein CEXT_287401 [Caerostris extrusa]|uniref:Uncharacterized protein n=1 Tax=Caerostris extrusa TaxID=172846 RepID=A0AAV4PTQ9_CAEEX|nr:hypothetical protein CEXT_287401 [Caerostris extrusa]
MDPFQTEIEIKIIFLTLFLITVMIENENPGSKIESRQSLDVSPRRTCPDSPGAADADGRDLVLIPINAILNPVIGL